MALKNQNVCDACEKPIDPKGGFIQFTPLRGGLAVNVQTQAGKASRDITGEVSFCNVNCVSAWLAGIKSIVPSTSAAKPATPTTPATPAAK